MTEKKSILIVQRSANLDGSAFSALLLANGFRNAGWDPHIAFGFEGPIISRFQKADHQTAVIEHDNWLRRKHFLRFVKDYLAESGNTRPLAAYIKKAGIDLVYTNTSVSLAGPLAARRTGRPCIWHLRELFEEVGGEMRAPGIARPYISWVFRNRCQALVANSQAVAENMLGSRQAGQAIIVPNAVSDSYFENSITQSEARRQFQLPEDKYLIGVPGTLRPMKGHPFFFRAIAPLLRDNPDIEIAVTGSGQETYERKLQQILEEHQLSAKVHLLGTISHMPAFYRACDLACIPSKAEPFGRTVIEAFASGVPVIASAVGGIKEIIDDGQTGLLVEYGDESALRKAVQRLMDQPELKEAITVRAKDKAREAYREMHYQEKLIAIADSLV